MSDRESAGDAESRRPQNMTRVQRYLGGRHRCGGLRKKTRWARDIISLVDDIDPGDRQLGELLQSLDLVDRDTLTALLIEARKQHRSLRQALLRSGCLTLYQMALIETGAIDRLVMGPVRVIDRLRSTVHETVYRSLRSARRPGCRTAPLDEAEAEDAVHPDEFASASDRRPLCSISTWPLRWKCWR